MEKELTKIREQVARMRRKGYEPDAIYMCYELWDALGRPRKVCGVYAAPDRRIKAGFEVR